ncbi:MAG TPA: hypothetical protein VFM70_04540 [Salinimicrobium sp.]|nr:hypothetical protein [Salinimicrobium sp.]
MKTSTIIILSIISIIFLAFITNPGREKHTENGLEVLFFLNEEKEEGLGIFGGLISTFAKETLAAKIRIEDYYLFSVSYIYSPTRDVTLDLGIGIFGQVFPLASEQEVLVYKNAPKVKQQE